MKVVILCGGKGLRAFPFTEYLPKPMIPVGGSPILIHLIKSFVKEGLTEFVLAAGYRKNVLQDYFDGKNLGATIEIVDTGNDTDTGGRIKACRGYLGDRFMVTYGDGLADVPIDDLLAFHHLHDGLASVTVVPLTTQYGVLEGAFSGLVTSMREKPVMRGHWINIGFMVFEKAVFDHWPGDNLERDVLPHLVGLNELHMYRHEGFFKSIDSYKDQQDFEELVQHGRKPWRVKNRSFA